MKVKKKKKRKLSQFSLLYLKESRKERTSISWSKVNQVPVTEYSNQRRAEDSKQLIRTEIDGFCLFVYRIQVKECDKTGSM